ncbi:DUF3892 domain-containing protein [[Clostridium] fimetarium]|uniref:DUF3892 domain-containing protein n=1 Tax=[Clostridium] fimetarium TaxID=99656 RepID=A0A1I0PZ63_9FIRM|nr:DUF3892 domain-containing protein [[Clostridium] fimetarium]SEW19972.1 Protein of unknown function [[Clostridium] fimetarium]
MADYGICEVHYNDDHSKIEEVHAFEIIENDAGEKHTDGIKHTFSKESIILRIDCGDKVTTLIKNDKGEWDRGSKVIVYTEDKGKFIRTKNNTKKVDNLGELPEY